jgi:hypothetical protein
MHINKARLLLDDTELKTQGHKERKTALGSVICGIRHV